MIFALQRNVIRFFLLRSSMIINLLSFHKVKNKQNHCIYRIQIIPNKHLINALTSKSYLLCTTSLASENGGNFASRLVWYDDSRLATPHGHSRGDFISRLTSDKLVCDDQFSWPSLNQTRVVIHVTTTPITTLLNDCFSFYLLYCIVRGGKYSWQRSFSRTWIIVGLQ